MVLETQDSHAVRAAQAGDVDAFGELVHRHRTAVYRVALRMLGNPSDAEDAAQEAFVQAWRALPTFRGESSVATWLYRIVVNRCLNVLRAQEPAEPFTETLEAPGSGPNHIVEVRGELEALKLAVTRLTPEQRAPFVLRELEGLSYEQIGEVLEISLPAVKGRLHRARLEVLDAMRSWR